VVEKYWDADSFFCFGCHYVAEPLEEEDPTAPELEPGEKAGPDQAKWQAKLREWLVGRFPQWSSNSIGGGSCGGCS